MNAKIIVSLDQYRLLLVAVLLNSIVSITTGQELYTKDQVPSDDQLQLRREGSAKITLRIRMNAPGYKLYAGLNETTFNSNDGYNSNFLAVVYNSCTDSDNPNQICLESQVTVKGYPIIDRSSIFFSLFGMWNSTTEQFDVQEEVSSIAIILNDDDNQPPQDSPTSGNNAGNNVDDGVTVGGYVLAGGVILIVLIAVAITVTVLLMCKKKNNQKNSVDNRDNV